MAVDCVSGDLDRSEFGVVAEEMEDGALISVKMSVELDVVVVFVSRVLDRINDRETGRASCGCWVSTSDAAGTAMGREYLYRGRRKRMMSSVSACCVCLCVVWAEIEDELDRCHPPRLVLRSPSINLLPFPSRAAVSLSLFRPCPPPRVRPPLSCSMPSCCRVICFRSLSPGDPPRSNERRKNAARERFDGSTLTTQGE